MMMQTEQPNADLFKSTLRGSTLHGKHRGGGTLGTGAQEALEAARAAAAKEKDVTGANTSSDAKKRRKKKRGSGGMQKKNSGSRGGGFEITVIDSNAPAHHRIQADPLKEDDDGEYGDESFDDDDDGYEDDFEVVGNAKPSRPKDSAGTGMVTVDVTTDVGFEATLINKQKGSKNASDRKSHRKSSADAFNETATSRAGLPGARRGTDEYATDDEVAQRTAARGGLGISDDNLPPLQPSRGSVATGRGGGRGFSPLSSPPSGYVSDAVVSPLPNIKRRR